MPLQKPKEPETKESFVERCMLNDFMNKEFPNNDQRLAVCFSQWRKKMKNNQEEPEKENEEDKQQEDPFFGKIDNPGEVDEIEDIESFKKAFTK